MHKKTIILTGTSSGLGNALFDALHVANVRLICISRTFFERQTALASDGVVLLTGDLSQREEVTALAEKLRGLLRDASDIVFINNAATINPIGRVGDLDDALIAKAIQTNFATPLLLTNMLCRLQSPERLTIVHVGTGAARMPIVGWALYCATKAGLKMFYDVVQKQHAGDARVTVHQFDPGAVDTPMQTQIRDASSTDFPDVEEFKALQKNHSLSDPTLVAKRLIKQYIPI
jgi:benzil reductase ((S)-benzoin forming)